VINAPQLPIPATAPFVAGDVGATNYAFTLTSIQEPYDSAIAMELTAQRCVRRTPRIPITMAAGATFTLRGYLQLERKFCRESGSAAAGGFAGLAALAALGLGFGARRVLA